MYCKCLALFLVILLTWFESSSANCTPSITRFTKFGISSGTVCAGDLIFEDNFDTLDTKTWPHEVSLGGYGNGEFQYYTDDRKVSYVKDGILHIKPRLLSSDKGEDFLYSGTLDLGSACTDNGEDGKGCKRTGAPGKILNPVLSTRMRTLNTFSFRYGKLEARAKLCAGDWLWPSVWMMPRDSKYGKWPASGEIDVMESRGNVKLGYPWTSRATLHWGPDKAHNKFSLTTFPKGNDSGYHNAFHKFTVEWTPETIAFKIDDEQYAHVTPPAGGFWELGNLNTSGLENPWSGGSKIAPFDQEFYLILNVAIGGTSGFFPETDGKPWKNSAERYEAMTQFWEGRKQWLDSWAMGTETSHYQVDYVRVWAL